jgi:anti-sigma B factor antagonist
VNDDLVQLQHERRDGCAVVRLSGEIDISNAEPLQERIRILVEGSPLAVVDLADIEYIDSQGLRLVAQLSSRLGANGTRLELVAPPGTVARDVLDLTRMSDEIPVRDTLDG